MLTHILYPQTKFLATSLMCPRKCVPGLYPTGLLGDLQRGTLPEEWVSSNWLIGSRTLLIKNGKYLTLFYKEIIKPVYLAVIEAIRGLTGEWVLNQTLKIMQFG